AEVEGDALVAGVEQIEERAWPRARAVDPAGGLHLDDAAARQPQQVRAQRPRPQRREVDDDEGHGTRPRVRAPAAVSTCGTRRSPVDQERLERERLPPGNRLFVRGGVLR